jgi:hypothetical protein
MSNIRREASRHFRNKRKECLNGRIDDLATGINHENIRNLYKGNMNLSLVTNVVIVK